MCVTLLCIFLVLFALRGRVLGLCLLRSVFGFPLFLCYSAGSQGRSGPDAARRGKDGFLAVFGWLVGCSHCAGDSSTPRRGLGTALLRRPSVWCLDRRSCDGDIRFTTMFLEKSFWGGGRTGKGRPRAVKLLLLFLLFSSLACNATDVCTSFDPKTAYGPSARANRAFRYLSS